MVIGCVGFCGLSIFPIVTSIPLVLWSFGNSHCGHEIALMCVCVGGGVVCHWHCRLVVHLREPHLSFLGMMLKIVMCRMEVPMICWLCLI